MRGQQPPDADEGRFEDRDRERRQGSEIERRRPDELQTSSQGGGDWYGYIQPYRYYGPGYRGVGYYSVLYQGRDPQQADEGEMGGAEPQFDQRGVHYGQGQGAGAAWTRPTGGRSSGASNQRGQQWGRFTGMGPKGYQRSDERIREDVSDRLTEHPDLDASGIEVKVSKGEVTLSGMVDSRWAKRLAEDVAESCTGVRDVMNQLRVPSDIPMSTREASSTSSGQQARNGRRPVTSKR